MFRSTVTDTVTEPPHDKGALVDLVPVSHLALDLDPPSVGGWDAYFASRNIPIVLDDLGRRCVSRADAKRLFIERREAEARAREVTARQERQLIARDQEWRSQLPVGVPAGAIPPGYDLWRCGVAGEP
jgi:hypothetical protein